jgi:DNA-binding MarR family transcriptional regulator
MPQGCVLYLSVATVDAVNVTLTTNEATVLGILEQKGPIDVSDCARLADLKEGLTGANLRSLINKGFAVENTERKGFSKKPNGTFSITSKGHTQLIED